MKAAAIWIRLAKCYGLVLQRVRTLPDRSGLTLPQFDALAQLLRYPKGMTAGELSHALLVTAGNVTGIVARLRSRGLVVRETRPDDRRTAALRLTPAGRRLALAAVLRHERHLENVFSKMPGPERTRLRRSLDRLRGSLELRRNA